METIDFGKFLEYLPNVLKELNTTEQVVGLVLLLLPVVLLIGIRDMQQPTKGFLTIGTFFGVLGVIYLMLAPTVQQFALEAPAAASVESRDVARAAALIGDTGFILPESGTRALDPSDIAGMDKATLALARNEIFARKGRFFRSQYLQDYFSQFSWYQPTTWEPELSAIELANVDLILQAEKR